MSAEIYYFSGTGNSIAHCRRNCSIQHLKRDIIPIISLLNEETVKIRCDTVGFELFPIHLGDDTISCIKLS